MHFCLDFTKIGGGGEIRTHGPVSEATVFKTVPLDHSGTPPKTFCKTKCSDDQFRKKRN